MDAERQRKQKLYESMIFQLNEIFPNHSLQVVMDAVKRSKLNFDLAMQYVLETPLEPLPLIAPATEPRATHDAATKTTAATSIVHEPDTHETTADQTTADKHETCDASEGKKKKPSSAALKRKVPQVKEMIPDASDEVILHKLKQVNGDVDKCILLLLEDPDAGTQRAVTGIEPLPSDSEGESDEDASDEEMDSTGSFDPNDLADWDDHMMEEIDGWFVAPEQQPAQRVDQGPNLLHKLYQELADEEIARMLQAEWREPIALPKPDYNKRVVAPVPMPVVQPMPRRVEPTKEYDSAALATFMKRVRTSSTHATDEPIKVRAVRRAPQLRQLIHMLRREKELAVLRLKMMSTNLVVTDDKVRQEEERLKQEKAGLHEVSVEDDATPVPEDAELDESAVTVPAPLTQYLAAQREELASLQSYMSAGKLKQSTSLPFVLSARLQDPADENSADAHLFPRPLHLSLIVVLVPAYPARLPRLLVRTDSLESQLRDTTLQRLKHVLVQTAHSLRGSAMIARLIAVAEEFLCTAPSVRYDAATSRNDDREELTKDYADSMRHILTHKPSYSVLDSHDILNYRTLALQRAAESLVEYSAPSTAVLRVLLTHFQWDLNKLLTEYREAAVNGRLSVLFAEIGVTEDSQSSDDSEYCTQQFECPGCLEEYPLDHMCGLQCRHFYCLDCYHNYLTLKINEGASDDITCPAYKCKYIIDPVLLASLANAQLYNKYVRFVTKSFVERNPNIKWCPAAGCNFAVLAPGRERMIFCKCGSVWCFQCMGEGHWPSTCNELKWFKQIHDKHDPEADREMKTLQWLLSYTKDCPKCGNPIEKNGGCNHMSCGACKYQFCWICLAGWHPSHYSCTYKIKGKNERENLLQHFESNMSFYSMYVMHEKERNVKDVRLKQAVVSKMKHIARQADATIEDCESLANAVQYIYLCRHVIMNICVVGDYAVAHSIGGTQFFRGELRRIVTDMSLLRAILEGKSSKLSMDDLTSCAAALKISLRDFTVKFGAWRQRVKRKQEERVERTMAQFEQ